jgi:hypothetical protein
MAEEEARPAQSPPVAWRASDGHDTEAGRPWLADREPRLLVLPALGESEARMRWTWPNGHPGHCSEIHRHATPERASDCFRGR